MSPHWEHFLQLETMTIFSCSKDDIVSNNQTQLSDEEKESIRNSDEFKKIKILRLAAILGKKRLRRLFPSQIHYPHFEITFNKTVMAYVGAPFEEINSIGRGRETLLRVPESIFDVISEFEGISELRI